MFLIAELSQMGMSASFLDFLKPWLLIRQDLVRIEGVVSEIMLLIDMLFRGTNLGPFLWNAFFIVVIANHVP